MNACVIDWAAAGSWAQALAGFAGVAAVVWAANKGAATFGSWLQQKQTERQMAVAERLLALVYRLQDLFPAVRSPTSYGYEATAAEAKLRTDFEHFDLMDPDRQHRLQVAQIVLTRVAQADEDWKGIHAAMPDARAYFGAEMKAVLDHLWEAVVHIRVSAQVYPDTPDHERRSRLEADFWSGWGQVAHGEDRVEDLVSGAVTEAERILLPVLTSHIRPKG